MAYLNVSVAKLSQRITGDAEDELIEILLDAAQESCEAYLGRRVFETKEALAAAVLDGDAGVDPIVVNALIKAATLLKFGTLYANREDVIVGTISSELPSGSKSLLDPHRIGLGV